MVRGRNGEKEREMDLERKGEIRGGRRMNGDDTVLCQVCTV